VDWSRTRAYALGLAGIFLNRSGREKSGIVTGKEAAGLAAEISQKLGGLKDPASDEAAVNQVFPASEVMRGPYLTEAPDLIVGYKPGYRVSWTSVTGNMNEDLFTDNTRAWSGDHCMDPRTVPGIFFCNRPVENETISILDIAPTLLDLFSVKAPSYMDGVRLSIKVNGKGGDHGHGKSETG